MLTTAAITIISLMKKMKINDNHDDKNNRANN